ncbi:hypothetical protein ACVIVC_001174 [Sinorhizobium meliloti]|nr:hypothetical protein C770_GR4pC0368 [Sinorhizobium meliloti GR4]
MYPNIVRLFHLIAAEGLVSLFHRAGMTSLFLDSWDASAQHACTATTIVGERGD